MSIGTSGQLREVFVTSRCFLTSEVDGRLFGDEAWETYSGTATLASFSFEGGWFDQF